MSLKSHILSGASDPILAAAGRPAPAMQVNPRVGALTMNFSFPPIYERICDRFPYVRHAQGVVFTWGSVLYNPHRARIDPALMAHESWHSEQQLIRGVEEWWEKYLVDTQFRFGQELDAHRIEYAATKGIRDRDQRLQALMFIARRLSSPLYDNMVSYGEALKLVRQPVWGRG